MTARKLARVVSPHFVAGAVLEHGAVVEAAPIIRYMVGWPLDRVRSYCRHKGWDVRRAKENPA